MIIPEPYEPFPYDPAKPLFPMPKPDWQETVDNWNKYQDIKVPAPVGVITTNTTNIVPKDDVVNHPKHYTNHPSGIEAIQVTEHMGFNLGNAVKYIWRCDLKKDAIEDLKKAVWYINREIQKRERNQAEA